MALREITFLTWSSLVPPSPILLSNSVVNSKYKENIAQILLQLRWLPVSRWESSLNRFISFNQRKSHVFLLRTVLPFFWHPLCSTQSNFSLSHLSLPFFGRLRIENPGAKKKKYGKNFQITWSWSLLWLTLSLKKIQACTGF